MATPVTDFVNAYFDSLEAVSAYTSLTPQIQHFRGVDGNVFQWIDDTPTVDEKLPAHYVIMPFRVGGSTNRANANGYHQIMVVRFGLIHYSRDGALDTHEAAREVIFEHLFTTGAEAAGGATSIIAATGGMYYEFTDAWTTEPVMTRSPERITHWRSTWDLRLVSQQYEGIHG